MWKKMKLNSKQRAYLRSLAVSISPVLYIGKASLTEEIIQNADDALRTHELIKLGVQKNCEDDARIIAEAIAEHTNAEVVTVIGKKILLYREGKDDQKRIILP